MQNTVKVKITMQDGGEMNLDLYPDVAPISVQNFASLAKSGFFDGLCFHRVIENFMIQGGGFTHSGNVLAPKNGAKTIKGEFASNGVNNALKHTAGTISMARTNVKDSASSQFFICVADTPFLDGEYAAFGRCSDRASIDKAIAISKVLTHGVGYYDDVPVQPVVIKSVTVTE